MAGYNERKRQVLEYVKEHPAVTSAELASALDLEIHNARTLLKKYSRQGLLSRSKTDPWGTRVHEITEKGLRRLKWLREQDSSGEIEGEVEEKVIIEGEEKRLAPVESKLAEISPVERLKKMAHILERLYE